LLGAVTLRAGANGGHAENLAAVRALAEQLMEALPGPALEAARDLHLIGALFDAQVSAVDPATSAERTVRLTLRAVGGGEAAQIEAQSRFADWLLRVGRKHALLIAVDDVDRVDEPSIAVLAAVAHRVRRSRVLLALTCASAEAAPGSALEVLTGYCSHVALRPLAPAETEALLTSVFGDVPNLALLAHRIHAVAEGRPRESMALAQHLVDRGLIRYDGGGWRLPEQLAESELPSRAIDVFRTRIAQLGALARSLVQTQALLVEDGVTREAYAQLAAEAAGERVDAAINELLQRQIVRADGELHRLANDAVRQALLDTLDAGERKRRRSQLAELCDRMGWPAMHAAAYLLDADQPERALDLLLANLSGVLDAGDLGQHARMPLAESARVIERALDAAEALARRQRDVCELRRWLFMLAVTVEDRLHYRAGPALLAQLEHDSGLLQYRQIHDEPDPMQRLMRALARTQELAAQLPESERVYSIEDAIKHLVYYVVISIAIGARTFDAKLLAPLPGLLEPFAALSPAVHAMWQNALATIEIGQRKFEQARERWKALYTKLETLTPAQLPRVDMIRNAIAYALGTIEAQMGLESIGRWAEQLDQDPMQRVNAMYLRKIVCMQRGDFENAERFRRKAEVLAVQATSRSMFNTTMTLELAAHALARDLTGVKQIMDRIEPIAPGNVTWTIYHHLAAAHFHRLRGDLEAALAASERALALVAPDAGGASRSLVAWPSVAAAHIEILTELDRVEDARRFGERAIEQAEALGIDAGAFEVVRALALAEGKSQRLAQAQDRLERLIGAQRNLGSVGLNLGASYEARARVAIWAGDHAAVEHYGRLAANEYRHGRSSPLGTRYERLLQEARIAGIHALPQLAALDATPISSTALGGRRPTIETSLTDALSAAETPRARAELALGLLCEVHAARGGHLFVLRDGALEHAATLGADAPDEALRPMLDDIWQQQLAAADMPTQLAPHGLPSASSTNLLTDTQGASFQPVAIQCVVDGATVLAGIVALIPGHDRQPRSDASHVVGIVGNYLIRSGDAHAVAC
jgi:hypothetical protein